MRLAVPFSLFLMLAMLLQPACQASAPNVPVLTLTIDPPSQDVNSLTYAPVQVSFNGTASIKKLPGEKYVVDMSASVDVGWAATTAPTQILLISSSTMSFMAYVTVPIGTPNMTGVMTVSGRATSSAGFQSVANVTAIINVTGVIIHNQTTSTQTAKHATSGTGASANIGGSTIVTVSITAVIIASVAVGGVVIYKKRKGRRNATDS